jgi:hypothetical protein
MTRTFLSLKQRHGSRDESNPVWNVAQVGGRLRVGERCVAVKADMINDLG